MAKVYVAGPWKDREICKALAERIKELGHQITHEWWVMEGNDDDTPAFSKICATSDVYGVHNCNVMVLLNSQKSEGKAVEQGIAIAQGKTILAIGERGETSKNIFHYLDNYVWVPDIEAALEKLKEAK